MTFIKHVFWYVIELIIWYFFFYAILFTAQNLAVVNIAWMSFVVLLLASLGVFANPLTRHLSVWNKILDQIIKREEEVQKY